MEFDPYIAEGNEARQTQEAIRVALTGISMDEPVHFIAEDADWESLWNDWLRDRFLPLIGPYLVEVRKLSVSILPREMIELEGEFTTDLSSEEIERSISAAERFKEQVAGAKHLPELKKLEAGSDRHFVTLFAARCASHHIPLVSSLSAYLYFELCSGIKNITGDALSLRLALPLLLPAVRQLLDSLPPFNYQVA